MSCPLPLVLLLALGQAPATATIQEPALSVRVTTPADVVDFGAAFPLTVTRTWTHGWTPETWDDRSLAPLDLQLTDVSRDDGEGVFRETRRYRARAFERVALRVPPVAFELRSEADGSTRVVSSEELVVAVRSGLPPSDTGAAELPDGPLDVPASTLTPLVLGASVLGILVMAWGLGRRLRSKRAADAARAVTPSQRARNRLAALRAKQPSDRREARLDSVETASLLRDFLGEQLALRMPGWTSEELLESPGLGEAVDPRQQSLVAAVLSDCDEVKFAGRSLTQEARERRLASVEQLVEELA